MVMFVGMGKNSGGLQVSFFIDLKITIKKMHQVTLFHTSNVQ